MLQERVVPALLDVDRSARHPRVWSIDSVADAVAIAAAYEHARPAGSNDLWAYSSEATRDLTPVAFSLSDIRCMPRTTRSRAFQRQSQQWIPDSHIAEQVILGAPADVVDLVTVRGGGHSDRLADRVLDQLRDGGHLLVTGSAGRLSQHRSLRPVGSGDRIFRKCNRAPGGGYSPLPPALDAGTLADPDSDLRADPDSDLQADPEAGTLAHHQVQADLVAGHARLARSLARRFSRHGESKEDLEQVALMALVKAARRYDPSRETSFSTYATASILGEIKRHFRDKTWMMRVPRSVQESYLAVKEARETLTHELSASPTIQQIAARLGTSDETVLEAMEAGENYWPESLDVGVFEGESGREVPVEDGGFELSLERQQFVSLLPRLAPRERLILKRLYFDGWTQRQVADEVGVSQMQISRLLSRTMDKLRTWIGE